MATDPDTKLLQAMLDRGEMSGWQVFDAIYQQRFVDRFTNANGGRVKSPPTDGVTPWLTDKDVAQLIGSAMLRCLEDVEAGLETIARLMAAVLKLAGIGA